MSKLILLLSCICFQQAIAQVKEPKVPATLKSVLLAQFKTTWDQQEWFVPVAKGIEGITAEQASWRPSDSSHSVGQLAYHLLFWNKHLLDQFNGKKENTFSGNNNETFDAFTEASWTATVQQLGQVMKDWEKAIADADDAKLQSWYPSIANMNTHNAYHTGQILYIRKQAGNWNAEKGVK
jgi:uncharacterized damage-inducible protein DinB